MDKGRLNSLERGKKLFTVHCLYWGLNRKAFPFILAIIIIKEWHFLASHGKGQCTGWEPPPPGEFMSVSKKQFHLYLILLYNCRWTYKETVHVKTQNWSCARGGHYCLGACFYPFIKKEIWNGFFFWGVGVQGVLMLSCRRNKLC
jgi:hypothetical protein